MINLKVPVDMALYGSLSRSIESIEFGNKNSNAMDFQIEQKHATARSCQSFNISFCITPLLGQCNSIHLQPRRAFINLYHLYVS